jgi:hypothetical protein
MPFAPSPTWPFDGRNARHASGHRWSVSVHPTELNARAEPDSRRYRLSSAAATVFAINMAIVSGPTPPGTGV